MSMWRLLVISLVVGGCEKAPPEATTTATSQQPALAPEKPVVPPQQPAFAPGKPVVPPQQPATPSTVPRRVSPGTEAAMNKLDAVTTFALGGVGFAGTTSEGEAHTLALARRPDAVEAFSWLADHGKPVARLYAYWALRTLAPSRAAVYAAALAGDATMVNTQAGCIIMSDKVNATASEIASSNRTMPAP